jgi:hypothetical protein
MNSISFVEQSANWPHCWPQYAFPSTRRPLRLLIGRAAYEAAIRMFPQDAIQYRNGAQIIARSDQESGLGTKNA